MNKKTESIGNMVKDIDENNAIIRLSTTLTRAVEVRPEDGAVYELIRDGLDMWYEERCYKNLEED